MTVSNVGATGAAASAQGKAAGLTSAADQQERFMTLLVAQMRNQDPLNPMDNAQMTTQIAQINTVAGIEKLNTTVQGVAEGLAAMRELVAARLPQAASSSTPPTASTGNSAESTS